MEEEKKKLRLPFKIDLQLFITIVVTVSVGINVNLIIKLDDIKYELDYQEPIGTEQVSEFFTPISIYKPSTTTVRDVYPDFKEAIEDELEQIQIHHAISDYSEGLKEIKELLNEIGVIVEDNKQLNEEIYGAQVDKLLPIR